MKLAFGPAFKAIEQRLFKRPEFIKYIPVRDRPSYIMDLCFAEGGSYVATDYTAFESLFTADIMNAVEFQLYRHMLQGHPSGASTLRLMEKVLMGRNHCCFKNFRVDVDATRMSGEMCTSLGNGFSNLMFMLFACHKFNSRCVGVVEGDDGLFRVDGPLPTTEFFSELGLKIKLEVHSSLSEASFCGIIFDEEERINVTDPVSELVNFGWSNAKYAGASPNKLLQLLRCKSISLAYQYPGCPVLWKLADVGMFLTRSQDIRSLVESRLFDSWNRNTLREAMGTHSVMPPGPRTRELVARLYGLSVERQLMIEAELETLKRTGVRPLSPHYLEDLVDQSNREYAERYVVTLLPKDRLHQPGLVWPRGYLDHINWAYVNVS
jgi:hypothetical protein